MTREQLQLDVALVLPDECNRLHIDNAIRLVVEACCEEVELFLRTDKYAWPDNIAGLLRSTFLPPKDPSNG